MREIPDKSRFFSFDLTKSGDFSASPPLSVKDKEYVAGDVVDKSLVRQLHRSVMTSVVDITCRMAVARFAFCQCWLECFGCCFCFPLRCGFLATVSVFHHWSVFHHYAQICDFRNTDMMTPTNTRVFGLEKYGKILVITPQGDASGFRYTEIHKDTNSICDLVGRGQVSSVIIDLGQVTILGSIIISSIIKIARTINGGHGTACFCQASPSMREVIHSMSLTKLWPYYETLDRAIASCPNEDDLDGDE